MQNKLFVGSLSYNLTNEELEAAFSEVGTVKSATILMDRETNRSRGFGFVEMSSEEEANAAIKQLDNKELAGRAIKVSLAKPMTERNDRSDFRSNNRY